MYANPFIRIKRMKAERKLPRDIPTEQVLSKLLEDLSQFWKKKTTAQKRAYYKAHVMAEVMYDGTINARVPGEWVTVVRPGEGD